MGKGEAVVITGGGGRIVIENAFIAVCEKRSLTRTVKLDVPIIAGVPLITPVEVSVSPGGKDPKARDQE